MKYIMYILFLIIPSIVVAQEPSDQYPVDTYEDAAYYASVSASEAHRADKRSSRYLDGVLNKITVSTDSVDVYMANAWNHSAATVTHVPVHQLVYLMSIDIEDVRYLVGYKAKWRWSYVPEWPEGGIVKVRIKKNKMYIVKPSGKELKTLIIKRKMLSSHIHLKSIDINT